MNFCIMLWFEDEYENIDLHRRQFGAKGPLLRWANDKVAHGSYF